MKGSVSSGNNILQEASFSHKPSPLRHLVHASPPVMHLCHPVACPAISKGMADFTSAMQVEFDHTIARIREIVQQQNARQEQELWNSDQPLDRTNASLNERVLEIAPELQSPAASAYSSRISSSFHSSSFMKNAYCSHCRSNKCARHEDCWLSDGTERHPGQHNCKACHIQWKRTGSKGRGNERGTTSDSLELPKPSF